MRLALTGRNLTITPALRQAVTRRLEKLDRVLHGSLTSAQVSLQVQKDRVKADVRVRTRGDHALSGHAESSTARVSVADAIAKVESQASKVKGRWEARTRRASVPKGTVPPAPAAPSTRRRSDAAAETDTPTVRVIRARRTSPKPMRLEDAILRVDTTPGAVVVFRDAAIDRVQVLVRRADGHISLVDPDA